MKTSYLHTLGVYGYGDVEPIVLAALVTGDPKSTSGLPSL